MKSATFRWATLLVVFFVQIQRGSTSWSPWGQFSSCSRTCGGGVKVRERLCVIDRLDRDVCKGKRKSFKLCNIQDCGRSAREFRAAQCEEYNNEPVEGKLYSWKPYYGHGETCELVCYASGFPFYHKLADKVVDGTPCLRSRDKICIQGHCKSIGCDMKIGSVRRTDMCGVCGGDNSTCSQSEEVYGLFDTVRLSPGYTTIVEIPAGATDIVIRELGENINALVLWDSKGDNIAIDSETRQTLPVVELSGTQFIYTPEDTHNLYGSLQASGPTEHNTTVYAVNVGGRNPGISYSFSLPRRHHTKKKKDHTPPYLTNSAIDQSKAHNKGNDDNNKGSAISKPSNIQISSSSLPAKRNLAITDVRIVDRRRPGRHGDTSKKQVSNENTDDSRQFVYTNGIQVFGGDNSIRKNVFEENERERGHSNKDGNIEQLKGFTLGAQEVSYTDNPNDAYPSRVELESRGPETRSILESDSRFMWSYGGWTPCSNKCGSGYKRRIVSCVDREKRETVSETFCDPDIRPRNAERCDNGDCRPDSTSSYVRWQSGEWGACSRSCDLGDQVKEVYCEAVLGDNSTRLVDDELCLKEYQSKPQYVRSCNDGVPCHGGGAMWRFSSWGQCSVTCDVGIQRRSVHCRSKTDQRILDDSRCDRDLRPIGNRQCQMRPCRQPERQTTRPPTPRPRGCRSSFYGCCPDGVNQARGLNYEGCQTTRPPTPRPRGCRSSFYGCCPDGVNQARGLNFEGCPPQRSRERPTRRRDCRTSFYGCCPDGVTPARGIRNAGCGTRSGVNQVEPGDSAVLRCVTLTGTELGRTFFVEWRKKDQDDVIISQYSNAAAQVGHRDFQNRVRIVDDTSLEIQRARLEDRGLYTCTVVVSLQRREQSHTYTRTAYLDVQKNIVISEDDAKNNKKLVPTHSNLDKCRQPPERGLGSDYSVQWYYNTDKVICDRFWYGGVGGNGNRFADEAECNTTCMHVETEEDICSMPSVTGRCRARLYRWYYNKYHQECLQFVYGGCDGNKNNFKSQADCERECRSGTSALGDDCRRARYGCCPDQVTAAQGNNNEGCPSACKSTLYGCCDDELTAAQGPNQEGCEEIEISSGDGNACDQSDYGCCPDGVTPAKGKGDAGCDDDSTDTVITGGGDDTDIDIDVPAQCKLTKETGPCREDLKVMWYYDTDINRCRQFWYGCQGNANRFKTEKECLTTCQRIVVKETLPDVPVCEQPKEIGPCRAAMPRYFYNRQSGDCEFFEYGGCRGNENNFESEAACEQQCKETRPDVPVCEQPKEIGPCRAAMPRYFYNRQSGDCEFFEYGGCRGNENNFESEAACEQQCEGRRVVHLSREEICALPKDVGPCRALIEKVYYNPDTRSCEEFSYGGCGGNRNNFDSKELCRTYCNPDIVIDPTVPPVIRPVPGQRQPVCEMTPALGPCNRAVTKYHYNIETLKCEPFTYGGCVGNHNNFLSEEKCMSYCGLRVGRSRIDDCRLGKLQGQCRANIRRWYFDARTGRCDTFSYGGCQGNTNNFATEEECMSGCTDAQIETVTQPPVRTLPPPTQDEDICNLPLRTPCDNGRDGPYWYYNSNTGSCTEVPNGECNNNRNNFISREQCEGYCSRERVCRPLTYASDIRCLAYMERFTYDENTNACEQFVYGGCGGTANNFFTEEACNRKCKRQVVVVTDAPDTPTPSEICTMAEHSGNCLAYLRNWRYDSLTGQCIQFTFGGCGGNQNNFETREDCERYCRREVVCQEFDEPEIGCFAYMPRWRYDPDSGSCENFVYGGCGGNANNFQTIDACEAKCIGTSVEESKEDDDRDRETDHRVSSWRDICRLQADVGPCDNFISKWHYNSLTQDCEEFTYGGCLGNHNNFESRVQCMTYCDSSRWRVRPEVTTLEPVFTTEEGSGEITTSTPVTGIDVCALESETGLCRAYKRNWFYDHLNGECKQFIYGGCGGNNNNFETQEECERQCRPRDVCMLPQRQGSCLAYMPRYFFDYDAQECKQFIYGGCDANANHFETEDACMRRCDSLIRTVRTTPVPAIVKPGTCPRIRYSNQNEYGRCLDQCRRDRDCPGSKKCCVIACSLVCIEPERRVIKHALGGIALPGGTNPFRQDERPCVKLGTCKPGPKTGYCPPKVDMAGLLFACAPACQSDDDCGSYQKCCHHGCGQKCVDPVDEEPYQMNAPSRIQAHTMAADAIHLRWFDPALGNEQRIRDNRYYTVKYYSYEQGGVIYKNVTDLRAHVNGLQADTEYHFEVRVNDPPYLSEWSEQTRNRTNPRVVTKFGQCPFLSDESVGICLEECQNDGDCDSAQKCCRNGCGKVCVNPTGYDVCSLAKDPGSCANWEVRWFFNTEENRCDRFWFGGCNQGNANNFANEQECERQCGTVVATTEAPVLPYDCRRSLYGCCNDRYTTRLDGSGSNCDEYNPNPSPTGEVIVPATPGESATLTCRYNGEVTWYKDGTLVLTDERRQVNRDGTLVVFASTYEDDGMYACHVSDGGSRPTIYKYYLQVLVPIGIVPGPDKIMVKPGRQAFMHCEVYGNPKPQVTWRKGYETIQSGGRYEMFSNGTLLIRSASESDVDSYTCTADNSVSQSVERTVKLVLREMLVARIENDNGRVMEGGRIRLTCEGRGYPVPTITWEKSGRPLNTGGNVFISSDGQLTIRDVTPSETGQYTCIVANTDEKIETSTSVQVVPKVMPDDKCEDKTALMKCRLIVTARLCGYRMYSKICCDSCRRSYSE